MDKLTLSEIVENQTPEEDEVLYLKPDVEVEDEVLDQDGEDSDQKCICWNKKFDSEVCCVAVHPNFPKVAQAAMGNCGDHCVVCDFSANRDGKLMQTTE
ncbi:hypothetical protein BEWA_002270 [Theileria equi strain WA]|uniref:Uncharacterized protein n=1 Tax=Theileria equi strain WA TaxID=1537102 RepID=L0AZ34_THEEQ|nr:hypothetical protein BEWA_002270 [Theileria equi strain WA]AFZ80820.1 hypothetical protein BEWA_002270 [Theileria equi strain WA]|eukprot:XP_004830486.1 hypothetical protein BEWA_002270 [Theileria equi strain WA]